MIKKILSYGAVEGIAKGLNKITLLALPLLLNTVNYGKISLIVSVELILPLVSLLGLERAILRFYDDKTSFPFFNRTVSVATFVAHSFLLFVLLIFYLFDFKTFFSLNLFPDLFLIIILVYFQGTNLITLNKLRVQEMHVKYFKGRLFLQVSKFILVITVVFFTGNYLGYLVGGIIASILTNFLFKIQHNNNLKEEFNKKTFFSLFAFSWPFIFHGVSSNLLGNADKFIMEKLMTLHEVGLYSFAYAIGSMMVFAYIGISVYIEPLIYKIIDDKSRKELLDKYLLLALSFGLVTYLLISLGCIFILPQIYGESYSETFKFIPLLTITYLIYPYYLKSNYVMIYNKKSLHIAIVSILCAVINIFLNLYLIPLYGIYGAVYSTFISYLFQSFLFVLMSNKFKWSNEYFEIFSLSLLLSVLIYYQVIFYITVMFIIVFILVLYYYKFKSIKIERES